MSHAPADRLARAALGMLAGLFLAGGRSPSRDGTVRRARPHPGRRNSPFDL